MLIRPQNGKGLVNFDKALELYLAIDYANDKPIEWTVMLDMGLSKIELGTYSTEERALHTIDMIEGGYLSSTAEIFTGGDMFNPSHGYVPVARMYYMPPDEDIEDDDEED